MFIFHTIRSNLVKDARLANDMSKQLHYKDLATFLVSLTASPEASIIVPIIQVGNYRICTGSRWPCMPAYPYELQLYSGDTAISQGDCNPFLKGYNRAVFQHIHSLRWQEQLYAVTLLSVFKSMYDKYENPTSQLILKFLLFDFSNTGDPNSYTLQNPAGQPTILPQETLPDDSSRTSEGSFRRSDVLIWWLLDHFNWQRELDKLNQELAQQQRTLASMQGDPHPWMASQGPQEMPEEIFPYCRGCDYSMQPLCSCRDWKNFVDCDLLPNVMSGVSRFHTTRNSILDTYEP
ncbi:hypothetical protein RF11_05952 [Thelohanellus kitauei]|uniref:Uncharacterized protein n=1 Tax=Thelohanellus kitauei TaxID=669202 RepID=A0A0C2MCV5_THEKT|nr:hypothetical protein RF11_05952 [Thelohanellus kitauei]